MKPQLYLYKELRKKYKDSIEDIYNLYNEKMLPVFRNIEQEAEEYSKNIFNDFGKHISPEDAYHLDFDDLAEDAYLAGADKYSLLDLMKYRTLGMWISLLCQVWEQQLHSFVLDEAKRDGIEYPLTQIKRGFGFAKDAFKDYGIIFEQLECWAKIKELRCLVNTIKHGDGNSADLLRRLHPDFFDGFKDGTDTLKLYNSSLLEKSLSISIKDFEEYRDALIKFWNELPEYMYEDDE